MEGKKKKKRRATIIYDRSRDDREGSVRIGESWVRDRRNTRDSEAYGSRERDSKLRGARDS